jgi:hypothetical protein
MRFSKRNKDKRKTKQNYPGFKFKPRQVNDSSQTNQGTDHLVSQLLIWTLVVVLHSQCAVVEGDDVIPQMLLSLTSAATHNKKTDVFAEQESM